MKRLPLCRFPYFVSLLLTVPLAFFETLLVLSIQPRPLVDLCRALLAQPYLAFLNFLPFLLLTLGFTFLFADAFFASALVGGVGGVLSLVSRTMVEKRDEPFTPKDFALIKEAGNAMGSYDLKLHMPSVLSILAFVLLMVLLGLLFRGKRPFRRRLHPNWKLPRQWEVGPRFSFLNLFFAVIGAAASFGVLVGAVQQVYSSKELYQSFPVTNRSYITSVYEELGFPYCFCYNFNSYLVEKPEGYSANAVKAYLSEHPEKAGQGENVNVVMVMNEAFTDLTNFETFRYEEGDEPLRFYNSLIQSDRAIAGHIVVPNFGGGTANTEFDVLTGLQTNLIGESGISAFRVLNRNMNSVFRVFLEDGYQTEFIHPGEDWFYNRQNVYRYFGAEKLLFSEAFEGAERKGTWVTDNAVLEKLQEEFSAAMEQGDPYFNFTVTIQNHMAYTTKKYGDYEVPEAHFTKELSWEARTMLSIYAEGIRDADHMLEGLVEYFERRDEPVVLVFFGDHLPNLGDNYLCYRELGMEIGETGSVETAISTFSTPYVIWVNEAAEKTLDFQTRKRTLGLPEDHTVSAQYLGALTLELTGRGEQDSYFSYLNELRRTLPVLRNDRGKTADGTYFDELPQEFSDDLRKLHFWEYHQLTN